jgi:hypothetical protein
MELSFEISIETNTTPPESHHGKLCDDDEVTGLISLG